MQVSTLRRLKLLCKTSSYARPATSSSWSSLLGVGDSSLEVKACGLVEGSRAQKRYVVYFISTVALHHDALEVHVTSCHDLSRRITCVV